MRTLKGGVGATLVAVFLAATFAGGVSLAGLTSTFTQAFQGINFQSDVQFLRNYIAPNVKAGCQTDQTLAKFPAESNLSKQLSSISAMRIKQKNTLWGMGDKILNLQVKRSGGSKKNINLDFNGMINSKWACQKKSDHSDKIFLNYTNYTDSPPAGNSHVNKGNWIYIPENSISKFRILEEKGGNGSEGLGIQVLFTDG